MTPSETAKEYLKQLKRIDTVINQKIQEAARLRARSKSVGSLDYSREKVQTSPSGKAPFIDLIERIVSLEDEINMYESEEQKIIGQIQGLGNIKHINVLYKRYAEFKDFEVIANELGYTERHAKRLHRQALLEFERKYLEEF